MTTRMTITEARSLSRSDRDRIAAAAEQFRNTVDLPEEVHELVSSVLDQLASGRNVAVLDPDSYITPPEAAAIVGVSRPLLNELLNEGRIPFFETSGGHRKIRAGDVLGYVTARDRFAAELAAARAARRSDAAEIADELGLSTEEAGALGSVPLLGARSSMTVWS